MDLQTASLKSRVFRILCHNTGVTGNFWYHTEVLRLSPRNVSELLSLIANYTKYMPQIC